MALKINKYVCSMYIFVGQILMIKDDFCQVKRVKKYVSKIFWQKLQD